MNYLLDRNACIALINDKLPSVRIGFQRAQHRGDQVFVSSIVAFELWYGVAKSSRREFNSQRLRAFFSGPVIPIAFEDEDAEVAGAIRAELERSGRPIGAYDLLIAGQALRHHLTLVTANRSEFARIKNLSWQDWAEAR